MANLVFYDFETCSSNVSYGQIIQAAAVLVNDNFQELDRYEGRCKLSPGIIPEAMALIVNKTTPKILKETNLSHYQMVRQMMEKFNKWKNSIFIGYNSINFDEEFLRRTLFKNLDYPYLTVTNGNERADLFSLARASHLYYPGCIKTPISDKNNPVFKLLLFDTDTHLNAGHGERYLELSTRLIDGINKTPDFLILPLLINVLFFICKDKLISYVISPFILVYYLIWLLLMSNEFRYLYPIIVISWFSSFFIAFEIIKQITKNSIFRKSFLFFLILLFFVTILTNKKFLIRVLF